MSFLNKFFSSSVDGIMAEFHHVIALLEGVESRAHVALQAEEDKIAAALAAKEVHLAEIEKASVVVANIKKLFN